MPPIIAKFLTSFVDIALRTRIRDDDAIDQLNHWATTGLLAGLALGTAAKQIVGEPIHCWIPAQFKKKHFQKYSDNYCWVHTMYNVPFDDSIPFDEEERWFNDASYYRWVFIVFLIQAFLFKFPNLVWKELKNLSGLNVSKIIGMALESHTLTDEKRNEKMGHISAFIDLWLKTYSHYKYNALTQFRDKFSSVMFCIGRRSGTYLTGLYMFTKLLYFANVIGQFFLLSAFLDVNFWTFGLGAMKMLIKKGVWYDQYVFPRIALCDYKVRQLQNIQTFSIQCVLSINLFLEKMYLIFWFWLVLLLILNSINLGQWVFRGLQPHNSERFLHKNLKQLGIDTRKERKMFIKFIHSYLRNDGVFMLRMVATNTSEMLTLDLVKQLWTHYKDTHSVKSDADVNNPSEGMQDAKVNQNPTKDIPPSVVEDNDDIPPKKSD